MQLQRKAKDVGLMIWWEAAQNQRPLWSIKEHIDTVCDLFLGAISYVLDQIDRKISRVLVIAILFSAANTVIPNTQGIVR